MQGRSRPATLEARRWFFCGAKKKAADPKIRRPFPNPWIGF